jgi:hypothetical protein
LHEADEADAEAPTFGGPPRRGSRGAPRQLQPLLEHPFHPI